jgi:hypothetical protein
MFQLQDVRINKYEKQVLILSDATKTLSGTTITHS